MLPLLMLGLGIGGANTFLKRKEDERELSKFTEGVDPALESMLGDYANTYRQQLANLNTKPRGLFDVGRTEDAQSLFDVYQRAHESNMVNQQLQNEIRYGQLDDRRAVIEGMRDDLRTEQQQAIAAQNAMKQFDQAIQSGDQIGAETAYVALARLADPGSVIRDGETGRWQYSGSGGQQFQTLVRKLGGKAPQETVINSLYDSANALYNPFWQQATERRDTYMQRIAQESNLLDRLTEREQISYNDVSAGFDFDYGGQRSYPGRKNAVNPADLEDAPL